MIKKIKEPCDNSVDDIYINLRNLNYQKDEKIKNHSLNEIQFNIKKIRRVVFI